MRRPRSDRNPHVPDELMPVALMIVSRNTETAAIAATIRVDVTRSPILLCRRSFPTCVVKSRINTQAYPAIPQQSENASPRHTNAGMGSGDGERGGNIEVVCALLRHKPSSHLSRPHVGNGSRNQASPTLMANGNGYCILHPWYAPGTHLCSMHRTLSTIRGIIGKPVFAHPMWTLMICSTSRTCGSLPAMYSRNALIGCHQSRMDNRQE